MLDAPYTLRARIHARDGRKLHLQATIENDHAQVVTIHPRKVDGCSGRTDTSQTFDNARGNPAARMRRSERRRARSSHSASSKSARNAR
ncbi:Uncharacterised protein [Nocardia cyriacigeorgica]|uniref:Uncharacterized protein n=1 Tax=Nocardia cyriacigeorgica TaxID=135487 RepID=A0A4U8W1F8_9NOCA|nr:Uncharacterised protein [Nocardia cyriacigeorgica]